MNYQSYEDYMRSVLGNSYANEYTNVPTYVNPANMQSVSNFRNVNTPNSMSASPMNTSNMINSRQMSMQTQTNMSSQMNMPNQPSMSNMTNQSNMSNQTSFQSSMRENTEQNMEESEEILRIQRMYPDIYCLLMPMVNKIVEENNDREITDNLIESMTMEIYNNIEDDMINSSRTTN